MRAPMRPFVFFVSFVVSTCLVAADVPWTRGRAPIETRWTSTVSPSNAHPEYPRPQMVRSRWLNLNGLWDYAIAPVGAERPAQWDGRILVPFPVESALSGVMKSVGEQQILWYRRTVAIPSGWRGERVRLQFGAVDWRAHVWVNGREIGTHDGGYDAFSFDITDALRPVREQELVVAVEDPTDAGTQPRGKQVRRPGSIWYTSTTGIWQTVWLEPVPSAAIAALRLDPDIDAGRLTIAATTSGGGELRAEAFDGSRRVAIASGPATQPLILAMASPKLWSPDSPFLYTLKLSLVTGGREVDRVDSYFGMRKISVGKDAGGRTRLLLNNQPLFQFGPLDQGFWPDGLYTRADRRGAALRHRDDEEARLQHGAQARQGGAGPLVLLVRQARPARVAGHAERRQDRFARPSRISCARKRRPPSTGSSWPGSSTAGAIIRASSCGCRSTKAGASSTPPVSRRRSVNSIPRGS